MNQKWWTLIAVAVGVFMLLVDITIVNVALPDIERALDASLADLQWVIDAYALSLAALLLTAGSLADRFGRRLLFAIGIVVFTAGSLLCGLAGDPTFLALARAGQGIGGALMFATALALISGSYTGRDRGIAFGIFGAVTGVAVAVGPVLGGVLTSGISWRWIFFVNIPVGVIALIITLARLRSRATRTRGGWTGSASSPSRSAWPAWSTGSSAPTPTAGARPTWPAPWSPPPSCSWPSWWPSASSASRCSTSACCASPPSSAG